VANFTPNGPAPYTISTSSNPAAGGTTSGAGSYASGATVTVNAAPNSGYAFTSWTEGATQVSTSASYAFTANANRALVANFTATAPTTYSIMASSNPVAGGTTSGGGTYPSGATVTVTAAPSGGYTFTSWTEGATQVSTSASYTFAANSNRTLVANFTAPGSGSYSITVTRNPSADVAGAASGAGIYAAGASVTVTATPGTFYEFYKWTEGLTEVSTSPSYTFLATANRALVANFLSKAGAPYKITTTSSANAGTTAGGGSYPLGATVTVTAAPGAGYVFDAWTDNSYVVSTSPTYQFLAVADRNLTANFTAVGPFTVTTSANPAGGGTTSGGGGTYAPNTLVTVTAVPDSTAGYSFLNWSENGTVVSTSRAYSFNIRYNRTLVANFGIRPTVTVSAPQNLDVALPSIGFAATCVDKNGRPCAKFVLSLSGTTLAEGTGSLSGTALLAAWDGQQVALTFTGTDSTGLQTVRSPLVYVESSPSLAPIGSGGGRARDYNNGKLLWDDVRTDGFTIALRNLASGTDQTIPIPGSVAPAGYVTPLGAILRVGGDGGTLYDWRNGSLSSTANLASGGFDVTGNYATFSVGGSPSTLFRRDLTTGADIAVTADALMMSAPR
jgi:hypothetical protein